MFKEHIRKRVTTRFFLRFDVFGFPPTRVDKKNPEARRRLSKKLFIFAARSGGKGRFETQWQVIETSA